MDSQPQNDNNNNMEDKDRRMYKYNLIIMFIILLLIVLFFFRSYIFRVIVRIKLRYNLIPLSLLEDDLSELESAQLITPQDSGEENENEPLEAEHSSTFKRNIKKLFKDKSAVSFEEALQSGLSSNNFDVHSHNIETQDERSGFDPKDARILRRIMREEHCDFDTARLVMQHLKFIKMGIDPATGMPLDSKAFTFEPKSRR